jgi:hypothetical protein
VTDIFDIDYCPHCAERPDIARAHREAAFAQAQAAENFALAKSWAVAAITMGLCVAALIVYIAWRGWR